MAKKISLTGVRKSLKDVDFHLDYHNQAWFTRSVDIAPGLGVTEYKHNSKGLGVAPAYTVTAYQGHTADQHWTSISRVSLKEAVAWANAHAKEAKAQWEAEE